MLNTEPAGAGHQLIQPDKPRGQEGRPAQVATTPPPGGPGEVLIYKPSTELDDVDTIASYAGGSAETPSPKPPKPKPTTTASKSTGQSPGFMLSSLLLSRIPCAPPLPHPESLHAGQSERQDPGPPLVG